ncbi:MAG: hypothetical protein EXS08_05955 [Planctomycetes bacterium]|nr:hypothetical protein [Planctomycetota bacterium]
MSFHRIGLALLASVVSLAPVFATPARVARVQDPESLFHHAYFLEKERGNLQEALELYQRVVSAKAASASLQGEAKARAAGLQEDLASVDLARLMPPETIFYAESTQPGQALVKVLEQLGLAGSFEEAAAKQGFAVRPELVQSLIGIRGLAVALTRLPLDGGTPGGVLVLHPGELETVRALIESMLLAQGTPEEAIEGVPAFALQGQVHVAVSRRLVVASDRREDVAAVLRRMAGKEEGSLLSAALREPLAKRHGDPFFCCLNAEPLRPLLKSVLQAQASSDPRVALAMAAFDPESLQSFVVRLAVGEDGLALEADLNLAAEHHNLVFNLLRGAPLDPALLDRIPSGVAAFVTGALSERGPALAALEQNAKGAPVVTAMDFGRELFANLAGFALYVVPGGSGPIPEAALVLSSNDPVRTNAILSFFLGFGNALTSGGKLAGVEDEIAGAPTRVFKLPPGLPLYLATMENTLVLSPSEDLVERALTARNGGRSVLHDEAFAPELGRLSKDATFALCAHAGRVLEVLQPRLGEEQRAQLTRFAPALAHTVVALQGRHSSTQLGFTLALHGLPRIDGFVSEMLRSQRARGEIGRAADAAQEGLQANFARLAQAPAAAKAFARQQLPLVRDDARALNNFAWMVLTEEPYAERFDDLALEYAQASNEASDASVWQYLDTLALAQFRVGRVREAIATEERALEVVEADSDRADVTTALARYRAAVGQKVATEKNPR